MVLEALGAQEARHRCQQQAAQEAARQLRQQQARQIEEISLEATVKLNRLAMTEDHRTRERMLLRWAVMAVR